MIFFPSHYFVSATVVEGYMVDITEAPSRIYAQYRNKPKASAWFSIVRNLAVDMSDGAGQVRVTYDIDSAQGVQLDVIGRIVVIPRNFMGHVSLNPGMFAELENLPDEFGDTAAMFSSLSIDQDSQMSDELYRLAIKSKIIKNNSSTTIEDVLFYMNFLLPNANVLKVTDNEDMSFSVELYGKITEIERWALLNASLIPKPQGVKFNGFLEAYDYVQFGDNTEEFGDTNSQFTGFTGGV